jgi:hypothetical protein
VEWQAVFHVQTIVTDAPVPGKQCFAGCQHPLIPPGPANRKIIGCEAEPNTASGSPEIDRSAASIHCDRFALTLQVTDEYSYVYRSPGQLDKASGLDEIQSERMLARDSPFVLLQNRVCAQLRRRNCFMEAIKMGTAAGLSHPPQRTSHNHVLKNTFTPVPIRSPAASFCFSHSNSDLC